MDEEFEIPSHFINSFNEVKNEPSLLGNFTFDFRDWFKNEIQHSEFIGVVLVDYEKDPLVANLLGFPMMVYPKVKGC